MKKITAELKGVSFKKDKIKSTKDDIKYFMYGYLRIGDHETQVECPYIKTIEDWAKSFGISVEEAKSAIKE